MLTVVTVPLIAVMQDLRDRYIDAGISCANWDPDNQAVGRTNLLLVAVEHAVEPAFQNHLQVLRTWERIVMKSDRRQ